MVVVEVVERWTLVIHDVDIELLRRHRQAGTVQPWGDRRRDMYSVVYRDEPGGEEHRI